MEQDILKDAQDMPAWMIGWLEPSSIDMMEVISMASRVALGYVG